MRRRRRDAHAHGESGNSSDSRKNLAPIWHDDSSAEDTEADAGDSSEFSGSDVDISDYVASVAGCSGERRFGQQALSSLSPSSLRARSSADKLLTHAYDHLILQHHAGSFTSPWEVARRWFCCADGGGFALMCVCLVGTAFTTMAMAIFMHIAQSGTTSSHRISSSILAGRTGTWRRLDSWNMPATVNWTYVAESYSRESEGLGIDFRWAQATGLHYAEYDSEGGACFALPTARFGHSMIGLGAHANGFVNSSPPNSMPLSTSSSQNSFAIAFGGISGFGPHDANARVLGDVWIYSSGVVNTTYLGGIDMLNGEKAQLRASASRLAALASRVQADTDDSRWEPRWIVRDVKNPSASHENSEARIGAAFQSSCHEDPSRSILASSAGCNSCNRWHSVSANVRTRRDIECSVGSPPAWCEYSTYSSAFNVKTSMNRTSHSVVFASAKAQPRQGQANMVVFGGDTDGGSTYINDVWYLSGLIPPKPATLDEQGDSVWYASDTTPEWRCVKTSSPRYPHPGIKEVPLGACRGTLPTGTYPLRLFRIDQENISNARGGLEDKPPAELGSGTLDTVTRCHWEISGFPAFVEGAPWLNDPPRAIQLDVKELDLDHSELCDRGYVEIFDGTAVDGTLLGRGCSMRDGYTNSWDNNVFTAVSGTMTINLVYESPCASHGGFKAMYSMPQVEDPTQLKVWDDSACTPTCGVDQLMSCLDVCHNHGSCVYGVCVCNDGYWGSQCEQKCTSHICGKLQGRRYSDLPGVAANYPEPVAGHKAVMLPREPSTVAVFKISGNVPGCNCTSAQGPTGVPTDDALQTPTTSIVQTAPGDFQDSGLHTSQVFSKQDYGGDNFREISHATTGGYARMLIFGGKKVRGKVFSNELWTLDLQVPVVGDQKTSTTSSSCQALQQNSSASQCEQLCCNSYNPDVHTSFPRPTYKNQWIRWNTEVEHKHVPAPRSEHSMVRMGTLNLVVVFGGRGYGGMFRDVWSLNISELEKGAEIALAYPTVLGSFPNPGMARTPDTISWTEHNMKGHHVNLTDITFDGVFAGTVHHFGGLELAKGDRVELRTDAGLHLESRVVFEVSSDTSFRFSSMEPISSTETSAGVGSYVSMFPEARADHACAVLMLDRGETMVVYGGIGEGSKVLKDVWTLQFVRGDGQLQGQWTQLRGNQGSYLISQVNTNYVTTRPTMPSRYAAAMVPVLSSANMTSEGILRGSTVVKESLLVFGGASHSRIPDGYNRDYSAGQTAYQYLGGRSPILYYLCPDSDTICARPHFKGAAIRSVRPDFLSIVIAAAVLIFCYSA